MTLSGMLSKVIGFLRAGYPDGVPTTDYVPLLALLPRRLSDDEVVALASELAADGHMPIDGTDIRVAISKITHEMPTPADADRVRRRLEAAGWPISDDFDTPGT